MEYIIFPNLFVQRTLCFVVVCLEENPKMFIRTAFNRPWVEGIVSLQDPCKVTNCLEKVTLFSSLSLPQSLRDTEVRRGRIYGQEPKNGVLERGEGKKSVGLVQTLGQGK